MKFLTMFPDGSAQVFYPSGLLAVIVVVTEENGRVCIVYDETPDRPIRAVFQSDGRGTCYHSNGSIWLTIDRSGGQCLDQDGARVRRWTWCDLSSTPTSLRPIFLSINRTIGLRVLRKNQVLVSFLAKGQQAKFSVGASCDQEECKSDGCAAGPSVLKEELMALAAQMKMRLLLQHLHQYLTTPSHPKLPNLTPPPHPHVVTQRLLEESKGAKMSEREKEFIHGCLQFCHDIT
ncbi:glutamate-rich protein 6 [Sphaeramia orbicularis]|uniref:glutamate-rich protein 6 n=1 Tax=Sphaeramia orbicularis TaxID=375764 RepID=UPI00117F23FF|nr:glutamate-rich protein 6 [Sphaeramia orbicularis]